MDSRLKKLYAVMEEYGFDAVAINPGPTLTYLTGLTFHLMERPVVMFLVPGKDPALVLPTLELPKLQQLPYPATACPYAEDPSTWKNAFEAAIKSIGLDDALTGTSGKRIGLEPQSLRLLEFHYIQSAAPSSDFPDASAAFGALRLCKDAPEVQKMLKAVEIAEAALTSILPLIKTGMSERELAAELTIALLRHGSTAELPFAPIVAAGPNSANPHAAPSERPLQPGDLLVIDWGATYDGYISDLTRTFALGPLDAELVKIHEIVQRANAAGRAAAKPGATAADVDWVTRKVIEQAGYGAYFTHRTGHGIGMQAHEEPYIRSDNEQILQPGMTFTIEPGIYLPERGGVRIEDNILITEDGAKCLSSLAREIKFL